MHMYTHTDAIYGSIATIMIASHFYKCVHGCEWLSAQAKMQCSHKQ